MKYAMSVFSKISTLFNQYTIIKELKHAYLSSKNNDIQIDIFIFGNWYFLSIKITKQCDRPSVSVSPKSMCWVANLGASGVKSETGSPNRRARGDERKTQTTSGGRAAVS